MAGMGYVAGNPGEANDDALFFPTILAGERLMTLFVITSARETVVPAGYQARIIVSGIGYSKDVEATPAYPAEAVEMSVKC
jgi:hypothetical protein